MTEKKVTGQGWPNGGSPNIYMRLFVLYGNLHIYFLNLLQSVDIL